MFSHYLAYFVIEMLLSVGLKLAPTFRLGKAESTEGAVDIEYGNIENGIIETGTSNLTSKTVTSNLTSNFWELIFLLGTIFCLSPMT